MKNENVSSEMIDIMRARNAQLAVQDGDTPESRLESLVCKTEDWHTRVTILQAILKILYREDSDDNTGPLKPLKVISN